MNQSGSVPSGLEVLNRAFFAFVQITPECAWEQCRGKLDGCMQLLYAHNLFGPAVLELLRVHRAAILWEQFDADHFARFYRFIYLACREPLKRSISAAVAVHCWQLLLRGRFRLLDKWCKFVVSSKQAVISEDTWRQVLDFCKTIHEDLSNYDASSAWPVLLDEFVEALRLEVAGPSRAKAPNNSLGIIKDVHMSVDMLQSRMVAVSPRSGSKRRCQDAGRAFCKGGNCR